MAAPNPGLRVPPSGPPVKGDTTPFQEYAGAQFKAVNTTTAADEICFSINAPDANVFAIARENAPQASSPAAEYQPVNANADADGFKFGEGTWLVEAEMAMGFTTDGPTAGNNSGAIEVVVAVIKDDNTELKTVTAAASSALPKPAALGASGAGVRQVLFRAYVTITADEVQNDNGGGDFSGLEIRLRRLSGTNAEVGTYDANSGQLKVWNDSGLSIRRYR